MLIAIACFDHCKIIFYELSMQNNKLKYELLNRELVNIHKFPVKQVRLSKKQPNLMVSCGDENDLFVKLWNVSSISSEPLN